MSQRYTSRTSPVAGLVLIAVAGFAMAAPIVAVAAPEWLDNGAAIAAAIPVLSELMTDLLVEDIGTSTEVECSTGVDEGTIGPGAAATMTKLECVVALPVSGVCSSPVTIRVLELPWALTLILAEEPVGTNMYRVKTTGLTGYEIECETIIGKQKDSCTMSSVSWLVENDGTTGTLLLEVDPKTETESQSGTCSFSGGKPSILAGADILIFSDTGLALTASG
jgi:hypothetical protein